MSYKLQAKHPPFGGCFCLAIIVDYDAKAEKPDADVPAPKYTTPLAAGVASE